MARVPERDQPFFCPFFEATLPLCRFCPGFLSLCETEVKAHSDGPLQFGVAGGFPRPLCPTLASWYDKIFCSVQDQSTLEP